MNRKFTVIILSSALAVSIFYNIQQRITIKKFIEPVKKISKIDSFYCRDFDNKDKKVFELNNDIKLKTKKKISLEKSIEDIKHSYYNYPCYLENSTERKNWENSIDSRFSMNPELKEKLKDLNIQYFYVDSIIGRTKIEIYMIEKETNKQKASIYNQLRCHLNLLKSLVSEYQK